MTSDDARIVYGFIASLIVPFVVSLLKRRSWPGWVKLSLAVLLSIAGAVASQYAAGELTTAHLLPAVIGIFTAAQAHYSSWFRGLGLEDWLMAHS